MGDGSRPAKRMMHVHVRCCQICKRNNRENRRIDIVVYEDIGSFCRECYSDSSSPILAFRGNFIYEIRFLQYPEINPPVLLDNRKHITGEIHRIAGGSYFPDETVPELKFVSCLLKGDDRYQTAQIEFQSNSTSLKDLNEVLDRIRCYQETHPEVQ